MKKLAFLALGLIVLSQPAFAAKNCKETLKTCSLGRVNPGSDEMAGAPMLLPNEEERIVPHTDARSGPELSTGETSSAFTESSREGEGAHYDSGRGIETP